MIWIVKGLAAGPCPSRKECRDTIEITSLPCNFMIVMAMATSAVAALEIANFAAQRFCADQP